MEQEKTEIKEKDRIIYVVNDREHLAGIRKYLSGSKNTEFHEEEMEVLSKIQDSSYSCREVASDYSLKTMTGIEFLEIIRRLNPDIRLTLITDSPGPDLQWYVNNRIIDRIVSWDDVRSDGNPAQDHKAS